MFSSQNGEIKKGTGIFSCIWGNSAVDETDAEDRTRIAGTGLFPRFQPGRSWAGVVPATGGICGLSGGARRFGNEVRGAALGLLPDGQSLASGRFGKNRAGTQ